MPQGIFGLDKVVHFAAYAALAFSLALWPKAETWRKHPVRTVLLIITIASVYGVIDELHQSYVPGRDSSVYDWIADTLGAGFGAAAFAWWHSRYGTARPQT
jgi:VanZ family protein